MARLRSGPRRIRARAPVLTPTVPKIILLDMQNSAGERKAAVVLPNRPAVMYASLALAAAAMRGAGVGQ